MDQYCLAKRFSVQTESELALALCDAHYFLTSLMSKGCVGTFTVEAVKPMTPKQACYFHAILAYVSVNVRWHGLELTAEQWADLFIAAWKKEFQVPGLLGGMVLIRGGFGDLSREAASEVIFVAEEFMSALKLTLGQPLESPLWVKQSGCDLSGLVVTKGGSGTGSAIQAAEKVLRQPGAPLNAELSSFGWSGGIRRLNKQEAFDELEM